MNIEFKNNKMKELCENYKLLVRKYGDQQAKKIVIRINELIAAENLFDISKLPQTKLHSLSGNLQDHYAVDLKQPFRLLLFPLNGDKTDLKTITSIKLIDIVDYH